MAARARAQEVQVREKMSRGWVCIHILYIHIAWCQCVGSKAPALAREPASIMSSCITRRELIIEFVVISWPPAVVCAHTLYVRGTVCVELR